MTSRPTHTQRTHAMRPSLRSARASDAAPSTRPIAASMVAASIALLLAGLAWPQAADALLRTLLALLAVGFVAALAYRAVRPVKTAQDRYSPFGRHTAARTEVAPRPLRELTAELNAAARTRSARRTTIPLSAQLTVRKEASRRLAEHHGLSLRDPSHHRHIRSLVSEPTWQLIRPHGPQPRPGTRLTARSSSVPLSQLGRILDDLEAL